MVREDAQLTELLALLSPTMLDSMLTLCVILILKSILEQATEGKASLNHCLAKS